MLYRVIFKNFRSNLKNYILFFISNVIAVAELFTFWGMNSILKTAVSDRQTALLLKYDFWIAAGLVIFITVFLLVFAMKNYIYLRLKDYSTFILLGMKKRTSYLMVLAEYCFGCTFSFALGILMGRGALYGIQSLFYHIYPDYIKITKVEFVVYRNTFYLCFGIMAFVFIVLMTWLDSRDLSTLMRKADVREKKPKSAGWLIAVLVGAGMVAVGVYLFGSSEEMKYYTAHFIWVAGGILILAFGSGVVLEGLRKTRRFYGKNLLKVNQLYTKYQSNLLILIPLFVIHFFALTYLTVEIAGMLPLDKYRENYPYDMVWMAQEKDQAFAQKLTERYDGELISVPVIRISTYYGAEHIGVSEETYEKLGGSKPGLTGRKIWVGIEDRNFTKAKSIKEQEYWDSYEWLHMGKYTSDLDGITWGGTEFQKGLYELQGIQTQNLLGQYSTDQWKENMIVFSNECFKEQWEKISEDPEEVSELELFRFPASGREEAGKELRQYVKRHGVEELVNQSVFYDTDNYVKAQKMRALFSLASKCLIIVALLVSSTFIICVKNLSDYSLYARRYEFLKQMGMAKKARRKNLRFEIMSLPRIAVVSAVCMALIYVAAYVGYQKGREAAVAESFGKAWCVIVTAYLAAEFLIERLFAWYMGWRLKKGKTV